MESLGGSATCVGIAIVSYAVAGAADGLSLSERRKLGRTDYTESDLKRIFEASGFKREAFAKVDGGATGLWLWTARSPSHLDDRVRLPGAPAA